tara:strand:- start:413 stop:658 length:246 start_codon:yes stop_codon:yes gene_type:complete
MPSSWFLEVNFQVPEKRFYPTHLTALLHVTRHLFIDFSDDLQRFGSPSRAEPIALVFTEIHRIGCSHAVKCPKLSAVASLI